MSESEKKPEPSGRVHYTSRGSDLLIATEENTQPGKGLSESTKKYLREKYRPKTPPPDEPGEKR